MRQPHAIRKNEQCRTPKRIIALACESRSVPRGKGQRRTFAEATAIFARRNDAGEWVPDGSETYTDPGELWEAITAYTRVRARTWLCGWKLGDELRIAQGFTRLGRLGWTANPDVIISDTTLSVGWHDQAGRSLLCVDLLSYLPAHLSTLRKITATFSDAEAVYKAFLELVNLQHDQDLGNFARTGASNASNHFRHRHMKDKIYVHDDERALDAERQSIFTGRTEAWRHGTFRDLDEWDLPLAYPRVGLDTALPVRLLGLRTGRGTRQQGNTYLGLAHISCSVPVLPCRSRGQSGQEGSGPISWPVGDFEGWYWREELELAEAYGAQVTVSERYEYATAPVLRSWAAWIMASQGQPVPGMSGPELSLSPVAQLAAKHWGRALIGKFGSRIPAWSEDAVFEGTDLELSKEIDRRYGVGERLTIGGRSLVAFEKTYGDNAFPALMSRVVNECRMRLWRLMCVAGLSEVYYVDTDSLFVSNRGSDRLSEHIAGGLGWGLRIKTHHHKVTIHGPRKLVDRDGLRVAGLPKTSRRSDDPDHDFEAQVTEGFRAGAGQGHTDEVVSSQRYFSLRPGDTRRHQLEGGLTEARTA